MARIALIDATPGTEISVRAVAAPHEVVPCSASSVPGDAALAILDLTGDAQAALATAAGVDPGLPLLLLAERRARLDAAPASCGTREILRKPCDLIDLRNAIHRMLESRAAGAAGADPWLVAPLVPPAAARILEAAVRLGGPVWIVGEPGTGTEEVATALARAWDPGRDPEVWHEGGPSAGRAGGDERVLWVPDIDRKSPGEQKAVESLISIGRGRRVVVTGADEPATLVESGALSHGLYARLSRLALRLPPLRERQGDIGALAALLAGRATGGRGPVRLAADAMQAIETYPWPGNLVELDAVLVRSLVAKGAGAVELRAADLRFAADLGPAPPAAAEADAGEPSRRAVVVPFDTAARMPRGIESTSTGQPEAGAPAAVPPGAEAKDEGAALEAVLAAFAHDIRNPMSTLKTFVDLEGGREPSELARLAGQACGLIGDHMELLQRYGELVGTGRLGPARAVDLVDLLGEAVEASGAEAMLRVAARRSVEATADPELARFVADAIVAECTSRATSGDGAVADVAPDGRGLEVLLPVGGQAIDRLGKWVGSAALPWRLLLARDLARRCGGELAVDATNDALKIRWSLPSGAESRDAAPVPPEADAVVERRGPALRRRGREQ